MKFSTLIKSVVATAAFGVICAVSAIAVNAADLTQTDFTSSTAQVQWDAPSDVDCYYIGWGETPQAAKKAVDSKKTKIEGTFTSNNIKGLKAGSKYYVDISYKVKTSDYIQPYVVDALVFTGPGKVTGAKLDEVDYYQNFAVFSWDTQLGVSGYEYRLKNSNGSVVATGKIQSETESQLKLEIKNDTFYTFDVRAYTNRLGKNANGEWSKNIVFASQPAFKKSTASAKGITLSWNKISGAKNYTIYASTSAKSGYKKVATTKKTAGTIKKVNGKAVSKTGTYYVYVIANKGTVKGQKILYTKVKGNTSETFTFKG